MENDTIERSFSVTAPARLRLSNIDGPVDIQSGDDGVISVTAVKRPETGETARTHVMIEQSPNGDVQVQTQFGERIWGFNIGHPCAVAYTVRVPRQCSVKARGVSSSVAMRGLTGDFTVETVSGDISLEALAGPLQVKTVSGNLAGRQLAGVLELSTVSGVADLADCAFPAMTANTVSGNLSARTPLSAGPYHFKTVSADVSLSVPTGTNLVAEGATLSGGLKSDLPVARRERSGRRWRIEVGQPGLDGANAARVTFDSLSGDLRLAHSGEAGAPQSAPAAQARPPAGQTRSDILDRVARGELSVDEALKALETTE